jgi:hypothetical protein
VTVHHVFRLGVLAGLTAGALACKRQDKPPVSDAAAVASAQSVDSACSSAIEVEALACSNLAAARLGDTLRLRLQQRDTLIVNTGGEVALSYQYYGRIGSAGLHVIKMIGGERPPAFVLVHPKSGHAITLPGVPILAPDAKRFATAMYGWTCDDTPDQRLEIWRFTDSLPVLEWRLAPLRCDDRSAAARWAPVGPTWHGPDTLSFIRIDESPATQRPALATRDSTGWRLLSPIH